MKKILSLYLFSLFTAVVFAQDGVVADDAAAQKGDAAKVAKKEKKKRDAKITSRSTYYDRKEGIGVFTGNVHVDDEE